MLYPILNSKRGFTLLEVLAAVILFAIMTMGIAATMRETTRLSSKVGDRQASLLSGHLAMDRLQREFQMAFNEPMQNSTSFFKSENAANGPEVTFALLDSPIRALFVRRTPGLILASYKLEKDDNDTFKLLRRESALLEADELQNKAWQKIATGILKLKLDFYDSRNDRWVDDWDSKGPRTGGYFPRAVRIHLESIDPNIAKEKWKERQLTLETEVIVLNEIEKK